MKQHYVGTKQIIAWPKEKDGAEGYAVRYEDGYISWSPKEVFEAAYLPMGYVGHLAPHQLRVVGEKTELDDRLTKLKAFLNTDRFKALDQLERRRLEYQANLMTSLSHVLEDRIAEFPQPEQTYLQQDQGLEPVEYFDHEDVAKLTVPEREGMFGYDPLQDGSEKA